VKDGGRAQDVRAPLFDEHTTDERKEMTKLLWVAAVTVTALAAALPAVAKQPHAKAITIETHGTITSGTTVEGTWVATGAIEDGGTYTETYEVVGTEITAQKVLVGSRGTIVLEGRGTVAFEGCEARFSGGKWWIAEGVGAYTKLHGGGKPIATPESTGNVCTGATDVTHAGKVNRAVREED
jgi:hypothetical protein